MPRPRFSTLIICQALFCLLETWLISKISLIGRIGIATFYKEYKILRSPWKTFLLLFGIQLAIILVCSFVKKRYSRRALVITASALLVTALLGLFLTFEDFLHTYSHRLLKERFHLGFYLFWFAWIGSCIFFLSEPYRTVVSAEPFPVDPNSLPGSRENN